MLATRRETDLDDLVREESDEEIEQERYWEGHRHEVEECALDVGPHITRLQHTFVLSKTYNTQWFGFVGFASFWTSRTRIRNY